MESITASTMAGTEKKKADCSHFPSPRAVRVRQAVQTMQEVRTRRRRPDRPVQATAWNRLRRENPERKVLEHSQTQRTARFPLRWKTARSCWGRRMHSPISRGPCRMGRFPGLTIWLPGSKFRAQALIPRWRRRRRMARSISIRRTAARSMIPTP